MNRMFMPVALSATLLLGASTVALASPTHAYPGAQYRPETKVSITQARQIALNAQPGHITAEELERERGGSGLRYSFDVKAGTTTHEVGVDARTGKVLEDSVEGPNAD